MIDLVDKLIAISIVNIEQNIPMEESNSTDKSLYDNFSSTDVVLDEYQLELIDKELEEELGMMFDDDDESMSDDDDDDD